MGIFGGKSRCQKGKSCGASCIERSKDCLIGLMDKVSNSLGKLKNKVFEKVRKVVSKVKQVPLFRKPTPEEKALRKVAKFDSTMEKFSRKGLVQKSGDGFDWKGDRKDSKFAGMGSYGMVTLRDKVAVKRGEIGQNEVANQAIAAKAGISPRILQSELGPRSARSEISDILRLGRVAMERAEGKMLESFDSPFQKVGNTTVSDAYWALRGKLHRLGIAHNDFHDHNVFIDPASGKATVIDFGLSQRNPKAALSEAIGAFSKREDMGDFQVKRKDEFPNIGYSQNSSEMGSNLKRIRNNLVSVMNFLESKGFSDDEIDKMIDSPIREPASFYTRGFWGRLNDEDAKEAIDLLYKGV